VTRLRIALALAAAAAGTAAAEPLDWNYTATFRPAGESTGIVLGGEVKPGVDTPFVVLLRPGGPGWKPPASGDVPPGERVEAFAFAHGDWELTTVPPREPVSDGRFTLALTFTDAAGNTGAVSADGTIRASGVFTSGTGNFTLGLSGSEAVSVGGRRAMVTFGTRESESVNRVVFQLDAMPTTDTPEPGTLALAGAGLIGLVGWRVRPGRTRRDREPDCHPG
jgi:hypothetical protein